MKYEAINNKILSFPTTWIDLEGIMLSEVSQRKINTVVSLNTNLKKKKNPPTKNRLIETESRGMVARAEGDRDE